jgi:hypothetical protein
LTWAPWAGSRNRPLRARPGPAATGSTAARADGHVDLRHSRRWGRPEAPIILIVP